MKYDNLEKKYEVLYVSYRLITKIEAKTQALISKQFVPNYYFSY